MMNNPYATASGNSNQNPTQRQAAGPGIHNVNQRRVYPNQSDQSFDSMQTSNRDNYYHGPNTVPTMQGGAVGAQGYGNSYPDPT